jgi:hypothetical protein
MMDDYKNTRKKGTHYDEKHEHQKLLLNESINPEHDELMVLS